MSHTDFAHRNLAEINIGSNKLDGSGMLLIARALSASECKLKVLEMSNNNISGWGDPSKKAWEEVAAVLKNSGMTMEVTNHFPSILGHTQLSSKSCVM